MWSAGIGEGNTFGGSWSDMGYGYGAIGPNGPDRGNWPGPLPDGVWWGRYGGAGEVLPAVTRATNLIVGPVVRTKWQIRRYNDPAPVDLPTWLYAPMLAGKVFGGGPDKPLPLFPAARRLDSFAFWSTLATHALWWGAGVFAYLEDASGQPQAGSLHILNPFLIARGSGGGWVLDAFGDDPVETDFDGGVTVGGRRWQIRMLRGFPPHDDHHLFGGVLIRHAKTFGIGAHIQTYAENVFHQGIPAGVLKVSTPNFGPEEAQQIRRAWMDAHGGDRRGIAVLNSAVDFSPVSITPVEADLDKVKRLSMMDIAHAFGLSSAWLDTGSDSLTYANVSDRRRDLVSHTLELVGAGVAEMVTTILPAGQRMEIVWSDYTSAAEEDKIPILTQAVTSGLMTVDEARAELKLPPLAMQDTEPEGPVVE